MEPVASLVYEAEKWILINNQTTNPEAERFVKDNGIRFYNNCDEVMKNIMEVYTGKEYEYTPIKVEHAETGVCVDFIQELSGTIVYDSF